MQIAFPYLFDADRLTGLTDERSHIRQMLELLLFTMPGERVNRPDFGCGIQRMVFAAPTSEVVDALRTMIESEIHRQLGDVLTVRNLEVTSEDATLRVLLAYQLPGDDRIVQERFERNV